MAVLISTTPLVPGEDCIRCGGSLHEARRYGVRCYSWGTYYKQHIWTWHLTERGREELL
jgi:hypothetical protein